MAACFYGLSSWFTSSPTVVTWNREITPVEPVSTPLQPDPNLFQWWSFLSHKLQDKRVFFSAVDLHQVSPSVLAPRFSARLSLDLTADQVIVGSKLTPTSTKTSWKWRKCTSLGRIKDYQSVFVVTHFLVRQVSIGEWNSFLSVILQKKFFLLSTVFVSFMGRNSGG